MERGQASTIDRPKPLPIRFCWRGLAEALRTYEHAWGVDAEPELRDTREFLEGVDLLQAFHEANISRPSCPAHLEEKFEIEVGGHRLTGIIDRVDLTEDGFEVIDYK